MLFLFMIFLFYVEIQISSRILRSALRLSCQLWLGCIPDGAFFLLTVPLKTETRSFLKWTAAAFGFQLTADVLPDNSALFLSYLVGVVLLLLYFFSPTD